MRSDKSRPSPHDATICVSVVVFADHLAGATAQALSTLNESQSTFRFQSAAERLPTPDGTGSYSWKSLQAVLLNAKNRLKTGFVVGVGDIPVEDNWFSRSFHQDGLCGITTCDWSYLSDLPVTSFIAYEIVENLVELLAVKAEDVEVFYDQVVHSRETRGCLNDMCMSKPNISFKIRTADICKECKDFLQTRLQRNQLTSVLDMLEAVRRVALNRTAQHLPVSSLPEKVDGTFPFPLAYCFRSMQAEISYSRKWLKLLELYEVILKYLSFAMLASLPQEERAKVLATLKRPSTGQWHEACFNLFRHLSTAPPSFLDCFIQSAGSKIVAAARSASEGLIPLRNNTKGHGFIEEEVRYRALYEEHAGRLDPLLILAAPLAQYQLLKIGDQSRRRGVSRFSARILMGSHPIFPVENIETPHDIDTDCALRDPQSGLFLSMHPWLVFERCDKCFREMIFLYDKVEGDDLYLREYPTNHVQKKKGAAIDLF